VLFLLLNLVVSSLTSGFSLIGVRKIYSVDDCVIVDGDVSIILLFSVKVMDEPTRTTIDDESLGAIFRTFFALESLIPFGDLEVVSSF
jgi:hypothetical protein